MLSRHDCTGAHARPLGLVGRVGIPVWLPALLDKQAASALTLPPHVPVALHTPKDFTWRCDGSEQLGWRLVGRRHVEFHGLPDDLTRCLTDWLRRQAVGDLVGDLSGAA